MKYIAPEAFKNNIYTAAPCQSIYSLNKGFFFVKNYMVTAIFSCKFRLLTRTNRTYYSASFRLEPLNQQQPQPTCCSMYQNAVTIPQSSDMLNQHMNGQTLQGNSCSLFIADIIWQMKQIICWQISHAGITAYWP